MKTEKSYLALATHYENCLDQFGDTHQGVDWPNLKDALIRYQVMLELIEWRRDTSSKISLLDFGCGASHLYEYLLQHALLSKVEYSGLDISAKFIQLSKQKYPNIQYYESDILAQGDGIPSFDYIIMNGVFTEKLNLSFEEMFDFTRKMLKKVFSKTKRGIAFNVMSKAVDWERTDLFHLPTDALINFLTKELSRNFIIRNDYGLYEYTVYLYK